MSDTTAAKWLTKHGADEVLLPSEVSELKAGAARVYGLIRDGRWHSANEIRFAAGSNGIPASEGTRRLRDLRPVLDDMGYEIQKRRVNGSRMFQYRICAKEQA